MYRITESNVRGALSDLVSASVTASLAPGDSQLAQIRGMEAKIRQISRGPETLRVITQREFGYQGVIDGSSSDIRECPDPLGVEWFDSTFAVAPPKQCEKWSLKAAQEAEKGRTVVILLPARTNSSWFQNNVLSRASEVRFIKGSVVLTGSRRHNSSPDCLAIFRGVRQQILPEREPGEVAIVSMRTSFTNAENLVE